MNPNTKELVFIPHSDIGHIVSTIKLAKLILDITQHPSILIICLPSHSIKVNTYVDAQLSNNPYPTRLTYATFPPPSNPPEPSTPKSALIDFYKTLVREVISGRVNKPAGLVVDIFYTAMVDVANELSVPCYIFFTSGAGFLSFIMYAHSLTDDQGIDIATEFSDPGFSAVVPGFNNRVTNAIIPAMFQDKKGVDEMLLRFTRRFGEMKGILINTYFELESLAILALSSNDVNKNLLFYPVGPILGVDDKSSGGSHKEETETIMNWLDSKPKSSVVFLCFGSGGCFDEEQVKEIAKGLDRSGHPFLWALRKPGAQINGPFLEALPDGFIECVGQRGKVIGWAPQVEILAHPAIGGFVSHCGWNSILESIWFGVPIAAWSIYAEQQMNAFQLVKELELGVEIRFDYKWKGMKGNLLVSAEEIEKAIMELMSMAEKMRGKVKKMSVEAKNALERGGSSYFSLEQFIADVQLC